MSDTSAGAGRRRAWAIAISCWIISGCAATPETPTLPPPPDRVGVGATLEPFVQAKVAAYARSVGVPPFDLEVWPPTEATQAAEDGRLRLVVSAAPPPSGWFATPLGVEAIAVIVNPAIGVRDLSLRQLGDVFSGLVQSWDEFDGPQAAIQLVIPPEGDELRQQFTGLVLDERSFARTAYLAPTPEAMLSLVSETVGAIGLLPLTSSVEGARVLSVEGEMPSAESLDKGSYPLVFEVIGTAPEEPQGGLRDWLGWLQQQE
jgi:hypothetical protein